ncbi:NAD-dependent epimerase/dehydratase family protein [Leifsonia poae]|uniref:NAD-dependent epimerase/dehydratase family protein n=1 Tax=Leifsonia poae TaxID=110933 RepID=UPI001CBA79AF|nr:NAD(P)-dependent oxidoreductase [Leifsonia poae]
MKVFIAGATGAVGSRLVPLFAAAGHEVTGTSRSLEGARLITAAGGHGVVMDGRDVDSIRRAVLNAQPDVIVHELTALAGGMNLKKIDTSFAVTNELRTRATDALLDAGQQAGTTRYIVQSFTGWTNEHAGAQVKSELDPLDPNPAAASRQTLAAIAHTETVTLAAGGLVLRYGPLYGPAQSLGTGGEMLELVRKGRMPIVGGGGGVWSFCHIDDAASATVAAATRGASGLYNIVDDDPAAVAEWLPELASAAGGRKPMRIPAWAARPLIGDFGVQWMTTARGSSNAKAKAALGWSPTYASWRDGFRNGLGE